MGKIYQIFEKSRFNQVWDDLEAGIGISMQNNAQNMASNHDFDDFHFFSNFVFAVHPLNLTHLSARPMVSFDTFDTFVEPWTTFDSLWQPLTERCQNLHLPKFFAVAMQKKTSLLESFCDRDAENLCFGRFWGPRGISNNPWGPRDNFS